MNRYKINITFKKSDFVFFNNKNIVINKLFNSFKIIFVINFFYKLKLFEIIKICNVFYFKVLNFIVINLLFN